MFRNTTLQMVNFEPFSKSDRTWRNKFFERFRCSNIYVLPMKNRRLKNIVWFHENVEKHSFFPNTLGFLVFKMKNTWKAPPRPKAAVVAINFFCRNNGEKGYMANCWVYLFFALEKTEFLSHRADFFDFYMRTNKTTHTPLARPSRGMPEDAKHSIYLNHLACQCIHLCLANRPYFKG